MPLRRWLRIADAAADLSRAGATAIDPAGASSARLAYLSAIAGQFVSGCNALFEPDPFAALDAAFARAEAAQRGFVAEGAAMGAALRDSLAWRATALKALRFHCGSRYDYLIHVGAGWAMARTPWRLTAIRGALDPLLAPLASDGLGFHDLYFAPHRALRLPEPKGRGPWAQAYDQGLGRGLWFVCAGHGPTVRAAIDAASAARRADLVAGLGLAMAYTGCADAQDWAAARAAWPDHRAHLAQGAAFAAEAQAAAGAFSETIHAACHAAMGMAAHDAAALVRHTRPPTPDGADAAAAAYQVWRSAIRDALPSLVRAEAAPHAEAAA